MAVWAILVDAKNQAAAETYMNWFRSATVAPFPAVPSRRNCAKSGFRLADQKDPERQSL
jgi:hypothetical protein